MCGLAGLARIDGTSLSGDADLLLRQMARAVAHRGPDEEELFRSGSVGMAFTRLSLVDPAAGSQPLHSADGSLVLIANGEVYNHRELAAGLPSGTRFQTGSDCEVLVHLYQRDGLRFLDNVRGMFALVLWDRRKNQLIFARDRFGIKPLFYHRNKQRIVFGSEMKALFQDGSCPRELDWEASLSDRGLSALPSLSEAQPNTWFRGIELAPAGTILKIDLADGRTATHKYWDFPEFSSDSDMSADEFVTSYGEILADSVRECETADVELGLFLSGGIDSVSVAALSSIKPRTFSALNGSTLVNGDSEYAFRAASTLGLNNHQIVLNTDDIPTADEWKQLLWLVESPQCSPATYYKREMYRYVKANFPEIKGMLLGAGSDEFNGGYSPTLSDGQGYPEFLGGLRGMHLRERLAARPELGAWWDRSEHPILRSEVLSRGLNGREREPYERYFRAKYQDVQQYNCWHEDRTAGGSGIEARVPFLDHRLVELVARVPHALRPQLIWDKRILRDAMRGRIPSGFVERPKGAFFYGDGIRHTYRTFARMIAQNDHALLEEALSGPEAKEFIDPDNFRATLRKLEESPGAGHVEFLVRLMNLGLLEQMAERLPKLPVDAEESAPPRDLAIVDWDQELSQIEREVLPRRNLDLGSVLHFADSVLVLSDKNETDSAYIVVDGEIQYVVSHQDDPAWFRLIGAIDGERTISALLHEAGCQEEDVADLITESRDLGILVISEA
ncbi:asparagine synthase (glutamine-hydrolyzing) [Streptomyces sp. NPDC059552]|uniref:asparagine synthase (glutamine-hydrolyzing) n=1 Tax=Streptomyces sp. NPDC059552 TaxID=3346862 RepID=UPI0036B11091